MSYGEKVIKGGKSYYNAARAYNSSLNVWENHFDLLHDSIAEWLETKEDWHTIVTRIKHRALSNRTTTDIFVVKPHKHKRPAGWNAKACKYFIEVNRILENSGYPIGMHAMNGGEKQFGRYSVDFYIPEYMIIVEYNEPKHYESKQKITRDNNRRLYLTKITNIPIIVIHEDMESAIYCAKEIVRNIKYYHEKQEFA